MSAPILTDADRHRFWGKVERRGADECWPWKAGTCKDGYGKFAVGPNGGQRHLRAHRVALLIATGEWGKVTMHSCDNPPCCNPAHLRWGTQTENRRETTLKGHDPTGDRNGARTCPDSRRRGERHPCAKLSDADVDAIRRLYRPRRGVSELAARFGVSRGTICEIGTGRAR